MGGRKRGQTLQKIQQHALGGTEGEVEQGPQARQARFPLPRGEVERGHGPEERPDRGHDLEPVFVPVLATAVCGYAHYVAEADAGLVLPEPFEQSRLDQSLVQMLSDEPAGDRWRTNGLAYAERADIYDNAEHAADVILRHRR